MFMYIYTPLPQANTGMPRICLGTINLQNRRWISYLRRSGTWGPRRISRGFGEMRLRWDWLMLSMKEGSHLPTHSCSLTHAESLGYIMKLKLISSSYLTHAESWSPFMLTYSCLCSLFYYSAQSWPSLMLTYFCFITRLDHDPHSCSLTFALSLVSIMTLTRAHLRLLNHKAWSWSSFTLRHSCPLTHAHSTMLTKSCLLMLFHPYILDHSGSLTQAVPVSLTYKKRINHSDSITQTQSFRLTHSDSLTRAHSLRLTQAHLRTQAGSLIQTHSGSLTYSGSLPQSGSFAHVWVS